MKVVDIFMIMGIVISFLMLCVFMYLSNLFPNANQDFTDAYNLRMWVGLLLTLIIFLGLVFVMSYNAIKQQYDKDVSDSKQDYLKNKDKIDKMYSDQLLNNWVNASNSRNKYFIIMFVILFYLPVPYYIIYLLYHPSNQTPLDDMMDHHMTPIALLAFAFMTFFTILIYTILYGISWWILLTSIVLCVLAYIYYISRSSE
jgi:hypothetical protein